MLKVGYTIILITGTLLLGYLAYSLVRVLVLARGIGPFFKGVILLGGVGILITLAGLVLERRKERADDHRDDRDD